MKTYLHSALIALTLLSPSGSQATERIIVIGAGIAGLAAAQKLHAEGFETYVLEARPRIGGRIWTERSLGTAMDMGASWIHGSRGNPVTRLAREYQIPLSPRFNYDNSVCYQASGEIQMDKEDQVKLFTRAVYRTINQHLDDDSTASVQQAIDTAVQQSKLNSLSSAEVDYLTNTLIEHEFAADSTELALSALDEGDEYSGGDRLFPTGYDHITDALASGLAISTDTVVTHIRYSKTGVELQSSQGRYIADRVIITVPLGVLKANAITFSPALPARKRAAINALGMGILNKVWMKFPYLFWQQDKERDLIQYISQPKGQFNEWLNGYKYAQQPVLLGFNAGSYAREIEQLPDTEVQQRAMAVLRKIYGADIPEPEAIRVSRWSTDPYALGAYSYLKTGSTNTHREILAEPLNERLFFAGEATSLDFPATTHGAYLSGVREAERLIETTSH